MFSIKCTLLLNVHFLCFISNAVLQRPVDTSKIFQGVAQALLIFPAKFPTVVANFKIEDHHCLFKKCVIWSKTLFFFDKHLHSYYIIQYFPQNSKLFSFTNVLSKVAQRNEFNRLYFAYLNSRCCLALQSQPVELLRFSNISTRRCL